LSPAIDHVGCHRSATLLYFPENADYISRMDIASPTPMILARLRGAGLRPTRQRVALARLLFDGGDRHATAEQLHG
jgi:hypothetical protein